MFMILAGALVWILNIEEVIYGTWSNVMGVIFTSFGVALTLLQWHAQHTHQELLFPLFPMGKQGDYPLTGGIAPAKNRNSEGMIVCANNHRKASIYPHCRLNWTDLGIHITVIVFERGEDINIIEDKNILLVCIVPSLDIGSYSPHRIQLHRKKRPSHDESVEILRPLHW
jgi:hypothetical protein